jgi:hypothetical protein
MLRAGLAMTPDEEMPQARHRWRCQECGRLQASWTQPRMVVIEERDKPGLPETRKVVICPECDPESPAAVTSL